MSFNSDRGRPYGACLLIAALHLQGYGIVQGDLHADYFT